MILMDLNEQADKDFDLARRRAWLRRLAARLRGRTAPNDVPPFFEDLRKTLRARNRVRRGIRVVDPEKIVGSVGRRGDFDHRFLPLRASARERWKRVDLAFYRGVDLPPVELYKLGDAYFVEDGNHRVSVARFHNLPAVEADVTEFLPARVEPRDAGRATGRETGVA